MIYAGKFLCCKVISLFCLFVLFMAATSKSYAGHSETITREIEPVVINGNQLSWLMGHAIDNIRIFSFRGGKAVVIPFQIDQKDSSGNWVWDAPWFGQSEESSDAAKVPLFTPHDELVFMFLDAGEKATESNTAIPAAMVVEIEIKDSVNHTSRWAYAAYYESSPPPLTTARYMQYRAKDQTVISPNYELSYSIENIAVMDNLTLNGSSIMDRTKIRGELDWSVLFFNGTIEFSEDSVDGYMEGYIDGPVRTVTRTVAHLRLDSGMTTPDVNGDHLYYKHHSEIPMLLSKMYPANRISMLVTTDYQNEPFDAVYIDGIEAPVEIKTNPSEYNQLAAYENAKWIALDGRLGSVLSLVTQPEELSKYLSVSPYLFQNGNKDNPPEAYSGSSPEAGYRISTLPATPSGDYVLSITYLLSGTPFQRGDERKLMAMINSPLVAKANLLEKKEKLH